MNWKNIKMIHKSPKTSHNKTVYAAPLKRPGFRSARSFRFASFQRLTPAQFVSPDLALQALIRVDKLSVTAGTLCAIGKKYRKIQ
jgi:hypothetical protein